MSSLVLLVLAAGVGGTLAAALLRVRASDRDVAWLAGTATPGPGESEVCARYLVRHRRHRVVGGLFGATFAVLVGIRWEGAVTVGAGEHSPLADVLFCAIAGILAGALSAESFRLSEPPSSTVSASLERRPGTSRPDLVRAARLLAAVALVLGALLLVAGHGGAVLAVAVGGMVLGLLAEATQRAITGRRRPVLSPRAQVLDLRMRGFASDSVARLQLAVAVLTATWAVARLPETAVVTLAVLQAVAVAAGLVLTVVLLRRAAPRPSRSWSPAPVAA